MVNDGMIYNNIVCIHDIIISLNNRSSKRRRREGADHSLTFTLHMKPGSAMDIVGLFCGVLTTSYT